MTVRQLLFAIAVGALFATLQGDPPIRAMVRPCATSFARHC
jgi:hypothetical protein